MRTVRLSAALEERAELPSTVAEAESERHQPGSRPHVAAELESIRPGARRAAIFVLSLEEEVASRLLRCLDDEELGVIATEIADLGLIEKDTVNDVLREFRGLNELQDVVSQRGLGEAARVAEASFPVEKAQRIIHLLTETRQSEPLASLDEVDLERLAARLRKEHPQTRALVLSHLPPARAAKILKGFAPDERENLLERVGSLRDVRTEVLRRLEGALSADLLREEVEDDDAAQCSARQGDSPVPLKECEGDHRDESDTASIDPNGGIIASLSTFEAMLGRSTTEELDAVVNAISIDDLAIALRGLPRELQGRVFARLESHERESFCRAAENDVHVEEEDVAVARAGVARTLAEPVKREDAVTSTSNEKSRAIRRRV